MRIKLGDVVRDTITGFTGVAIGRSVWLYGCERIGIEPAELRDGRPMDPVFFDEQRVEVVASRFAVCCTTCGESNHPSDNCPDNMQPVLSTPTVDEPPEKTEPAKPDGLEVTITPSAADNGGGRWVAATTTAKDGVLRQIDADRKIVAEGGTLFLCVGSLRMKLADIDEKCRVCEASLVEFATLTERGDRDGKVLCRCGKCGKNQCGGPQNDDRGRGDTERGGTAVTTLGMRSDGWSTRRDC